MQNMTKTIGNKIPGFLEAKTYIDLLKAFPPRSITSEAELDQFQNIIDFFLDKPSRTENEREYIHLLGLLIQEYEEKHYRIADPSISDILVNLIEEHQVSFSDLSDIFESESGFNAVLAGEQDLNLKQIHKLAKIFHVSPTIFMIRPVTRKKSLRGCLKNYAQPNLIADEQDIWPAIVGGSDEYC